ncbi:MAG: hypothetical protein AB8B83_06325 [Bdellovibrionales bacterium]
MPTSRERENYTNEIIEAIAESGVDSDDNDPGYPDVFITDDIPENSVAVFKRPDEVTSEPFMAIGIEAIDAALATGKPFNLVDPIIHERRHFKQYCAGAGIQETMLPHVSALVSLFDETDAYVYTASRMAGLYAKPETRWMTEIADDQKEIGQGYLNFETYLEKMEGSERSPEQILARMLLFYTRGHFPLDQMCLDLKHKLWQLEEAHKLVTGYGEVGIPAKNWLAQPNLEGWEPFELHSYYKATDMFADDDGAFDWVHDENLMQSVLKPDCIDDYEQIMRQIRSRHAQLQGAIRLRHDVDHIGNG